MNWYKKAQINNEIEIPSLLYHATFKANIENIKQKGLNPYIDGIRKCWEDCINGVYLHVDPDVAASHVESSDNPNIPDEWFDDIISLEIDTIFLDKNLLKTDPNIHPPDNIYSFLYEGIIPYSAVRNIL